MGYQTLGVTQKSGLSLTMLIGIRVDVAIGYQFAQEEGNRALEEQ